MPWIIPYWAIIGDVYGKLNVLKSNKKKNANDTSGW